MTTVKINDDIHTIIRKKAKKTGTLIERIVDDILRPWYEKEKIEQKKMEPKEE